MSGGAGRRKRAWDAGNELFPVAWMRITQGPLGKMCVVKAIQKSLRVNVLEVLKRQKITVHVFAHNKRECKGNFIT